MLCERCGEREAKVKVCTSCKYAPMRSILTTSSIVAENLERLRAERQLSIAQVCKATGIDQMTYRRMARNKNGVHLKYYVYWAEFYDVPLHTLFLPVP
jgi:hypothetical protein